MSTTYARFFGEWNVKSIIFQLN